MWKYVKRYLPFAVLAALFMVGEVAMDLIQPGLMSRIVDDGVLGVSNNGQGSQALIWQLGGLMIGLVLFGGFCGSMNNVFVHMAAQNIGNEMRKDCFRRTMSFSFSQMDRFGTGSFVTRMTNDITQVQNFVAQFVRGMIRTTMLTFGSIFCMFQLHAKFGEIVLGAFPFLLGCMVFCLYKGSPYFSKLQEKLDELNQTMQEDISGIRIMKACVQEAYEKKRFGKANDALIKIQLRVLVIFAFMNPTTHMLMYLVIALLLSAGAKMAGAGLIAPGMIMAAITYTTQLLNGILMLVMLFQNIVRGAASWKRVEEILDTQPELLEGSFDGNTNKPACAPGQSAPLRMKGQRAHLESLNLCCRSAADFHSKPACAPGQSAPRCMKGEIEFRNVSFSYPGTNQKVLQHVNLKIYPGETVAIMGSTGCGKTTLVNLISRFYDATEGKVLVDGVDVREYQQKALKQKIAFALQKSELFSVSIAENIVWGLPNAGLDRIQEAAKIAQADAFIQNSAEKYETIAAERGMNFSGGQKQRISLARAVIKPAEILILDDASSALDLKTEADFYAALAKEKPDMTKLLVVQRIASARRADRILVLEHGEIVGSGTHEELLRHCRAYQDIYASQMGAEGAFK